MSIQEQLMEDMKSAMKSGDKSRLETIRGLRSQLKNAEIEKGKPLTDEDVVNALTAAAKKRRESIEMFKQGQRPERAAEEENELKVIQEYLPKQMSEEEISRVVDQVIEKVSPGSPQDMGKVMGKLMPQVKGRADGKLIQKIVREKLATL